MERQVGVAMEYEGETFDEGFRADLIVEGLVIVELKSVVRVTPAHQKQLLTYLRLTGLKLGYLLYFGKALMRDGITRTINGYLDCEPPCLGASVREGFIESGSRGGCPPGPHTTGRTGPYHGGVSDELSVASSLGTVGSEVRDPPALGCDHALPDPPRKGSRRAARMISRVRDDGFPSRFLVSTRHLGIRRALSEHMNTYSPRRPRHSCSLAGSRGSSDP